jgi:hypothetical protein
MQIRHLCHVLEIIEKRTVSYVIVEDLEPNCRILR